MPWNVPAHVRASELLRDVLKAMLLYLVTLAYRRHTSGRLSSPQLEDKPIVRLSEELRRLDEDNALHQRLESRRYLKGNG